MTRILHIILCILFSFPAFGQAYMKLIEKGKYSKAEKKLNKSLVKQPDDIALNYSMALLLTKRGYKGYDPKRSYEFLLKSNRTYMALNDEKTVKNLNKVSINSAWFTAYTDTITRCALHDAIALNTVEAYQDFLNVYRTAPESYQRTAAENRDAAAYKITLSQNTVEAYQRFIDSYPDAMQIHDAVSKRDALAFEKAKQTDKIEAYKAFVQTYPKASEVKQAWARVHELAFAEAMSINTSMAFNTFMAEYPQATQYQEAKSRFEEKQFFENTIAGDWLSFREFAESYPSNPWISAAQDSILNISQRTGSIHGLNYCVDNFEGARRNKALLMFHDVFTDDGETETLDLFYSKYDDEILKDIQYKDYEQAALGNKLKLHLPFRQKDQMLYDEFIKLAAPRERAFVALQRLVSNDIAIRDWRSAFSKVKSYYPYFEGKTRKLDELLAVLEAKWDNSIRVHTAGSGINSAAGEYVPVISADDKYLYFCGKDRKDNIGGEDIYVSRKINGEWSKAQVITDLSSRFSNDAPLSVSVDGTQILVFKSGELAYSEKSANGWDYPVKFPEVINSADWQADAMTTSDGKALLFTATREDAFNLYVDNPLTYHGDSKHASDIYISLFDEVNGWSEPINLGSIINTAYSERMPFLHPDMKTLYFSSDGHGGLGKLDVFKASRLADTCWNCWSEPVNMGKEINTEESDWGYKISTDGERAYFSKKASSSDEDDIFWLNIPNHLRPDLVATVAGKLVDKDNKPVTAEIRWEDLETGKNVGRSKSDPADGSFFIVLPLGKIYGYFVDHDEYFPISNNIDLRTDNAKPVKIEETISMVTFQQMIENGTAVPVNNLFFNFSASSLLPYSLPELKRVAAIIKANNLKVEISGHTDNVGDDRQNLLLSEQRAAAVKEFLVREGCSVANLSVLGHGKTRPIASNETEIGRAKNRRVELRLVN